jgi:hypothetical protein
LGVSSITDIDRLRNADGVKNRRPELISGAVYVANYLLFLYEVDGRLWGPMGYQPEIFAAFQDA